VEEREDSFGTGDEEAEEIARKMLGVLDDRSISEMTGLTLEELQSLRSLS
jgi:hypothetical protein